MIAALPVTVMTMMLAVVAEHLIALRAASHETVHVVVRPERRGLP